MISGHNRRMGNPDPVSVHFYGTARRLLARARAAGRGQWVSVVLRDPSTDERVQYSRDYGIDVAAPDDLPGGLAKTRWARALMRAVYHEHKALGRSGAVRVEVGRRIPGSGIRPAGRQFRVMIDLGGQVALRAVRRLPDSERIYTDSGAQAGRAADAGQRDYT